MKIKMDPTMSLMNGDELDTTWTMFFREDGSFRYEMLSYKVVRDGKVIRKEDMLTDEGTVEGRA